MECEPAEGRLFVFVAHVGTGFAHRLYGLVQRNVVSSIAAHSHARGGDCLDRRNRISLDARNLHETTHGVARETEVVFNANLRGVLDHLRAPPENLGERARGH